MRLRCAWTPPHINDATLCANLSANKLSRAWGRQMRRREFITLLAIIAAARSSTASAQQSTKRLIGVLSNLSGDSYESIFPAFHRGLSETGYVEGQNVAIEYRYADGQIDRLPALAADLVNRKSAVFSAPEDGGARASAPSALSAQEIVPCVPTALPVAGGGKALLGELAT
jgi:putative ABC transport system substrate-binding protein